MSKPNRARRRIAERIKRDALALATSAEQAAEPVKLKRARTRTRLEELEARASITKAQRRAGERLARDYAWCGEQIGRWSLDTSHVDRGRQEDRPRRGRSRPGRNSSRPYRSLTSGSARS